jgi:hypothetical protein
MSRLTRSTGTARTVKIAAVALMVGAVVPGCARGDATPAAATPDLGRPLHRPANFDPSIPGLVACSDVVLEGDVLRVIDGRPGRMLATLTVDHWVKPATGPGRVTLSLVDIAGEGAYHRWPPGTHLRLVVDVDPASLPEWQFTSEQFAALEQAVPQAHRLQCPYGPRDRRPGALRPADLSAG